MVSSAAGWSLWDESEQEMSQEGNFYAIVELTYFVHMRVQAFPVIASPIHLDPRVNK